MEVKIYFCLHVQSMSKTKRAFLRAVARAGEIVSLLFSFLSVKKLEKGKYLGSFLISVRRTPARLSEAVG